MRMQSIRILTALLFALAVLPYRLDAAEMYLPAPLPANFSADGKSISNGGRLQAVIVDPTPNLAPRKIAPPINLNVAALTATATFNIIYIPAGGTDAWGQTCYDFPATAKAAFNAAASIWANIISSKVPITIQACWSDLGSSSTLGYSGGGPVWRDFPNAPRSGTWYGSALANSLVGEDLDTDQPDMHITYNKNFSWYYGTDGYTPLNQFDLLTVVLHEIAHGLNFSGSMRYDTATGQGSWGYETVYPAVYDVFIKDRSGQNLSIYTTPSVALGTALTSGSLWFYGPKAMAANGGQPVKIYAPAPWNSGSSYSHLDYATFNNTANQLMVYAVSPGEAVHDPGPVVKGMLKDMDWPALPMLFGPSPADGATVSSYNASSRLLQLNIANAESCTIHYGTDSSTFASASGIISNGYCSADVAYGVNLTNDGTNYWYVEATNAEGTARYPENGTLSFTASSTPIESKPLPWLQLLL